VLQWHDAAEEFIQTTSTCCVDSPTAIRKQ